MAEPRIPLDECLLNLIPKPRNRDEPEEEIPGALVASPSGAMGAREALRREEELPSRSPVMKQW
jgi:hypothetical protein